MKYSLPDLHDLLNKDYPDLRIHYPNPSEPRLTGIRLYSPETTDDLKNNLIVCDFSKYSPSMLPKPEYQYLFIGEPDQRFEDLNYMWLPKGNDLFRLVNKAGDLIDFYVQWEQNLIDMAVNGAGLQELIIYSAPVFNNPIIVYDSSFKIIAENAGLYISEQSEEFFPNALPWVADSGNTYFGDKTVAISKDNNLFSQIERKDKPFFIRDFVFPVRSGRQRKFDVLVSRIKNNSQTFAYISIVATEEKLLPIQENLAGILSSCCSIVYEREWLQNMQAEVGSSFLKRSCENRDLGHKYYQYQLRQLGWDQEDHYLIAVAETRNRESLSAYGAAYYEYTLKSVFPEMLCDIIDDHFVFLIHKRKLSPSFEGEMDELKRIILNNQLICGCSTVFNSFKEVHSHYNQALTALDLADAKTDRCSVFSYSDLLSRHVALFFAQSFNAPEYIHPAVQELHYYDQKHNSQLLRTLYTYLIHSKSHQSCCEQLAIHKSTLQYRLNKIRDLTGDSCFIPDHIPNILTSIELLSAYEAEY